MNKVYVAGPMTGQEFFNFPMFDTVAKYYRKKKFEVFNPADHDRFLLGKDKDWMPAVEDSVGPWKTWGIPNSPSLRQMLGADLQWIANNATHICMMPEWENSRGARAEWALAVALDLEIHYWK